MVIADYWTTGSGADQPGAWQTLLSDTHLPWRIGVPERRPGDRFEAWARRRWIDDLALVDCECEPCSGSRRRPELAATDGEFVVVFMALAGRETVEQGGTQAGPAGTRVVGRDGRPQRHALPGSECGDRATQVGTCSSSARSTVA